MKKEVVNVTCSWLSLALPWLSPIKDTIESVYSFSDQIVFGKLYDIMINQDSDFDDWLKLSEKFDEDSKSYQKMVELWGTAPQSIMTIPQRIQNHHCIAAQPL